MEGGLLLFAQTPTKHAIGLQVLLDKSPSFFAARECTHALFSFAPMDKSQSQTCLHCLNCSSNKSLGREE